MRYALKIFFVINLMLFNRNIHAQKNDSVRVFVDSALNIMQRHSMNSGKLNWQKIRDSAYVISKNASSYKEAEPAIKYAFNQLDDKHGWLVFNDVSYKNPAYPPDTGRVSENISKAALHGPKIYSGTVAEKYAYISIPFFGGQDTTSMQRFAQQIQDSLCKHLKPSINGLILDLRLNAGGNIYPMITGISNVYGYQRDTGINYSFAGDWDLKNNGIKLTETFYVYLKNNCGDYTHLPVAVLVGPVTGSSGEFLALAFSTRPTTILIGEATAGYTTANIGFYLPGIDNGIVVSESAAVDKNGEVYLNGIEPHIKVEGDDFFNHENDPKIQTAVEWLHKQKSLK
jgi:carboxyl-terminal processing protease